MRALNAHDFLRIQYATYRHPRTCGESNSDIETICALRPFHRLVALGAAALVSTLRPECLARNGASEFTRGVEITAAGAFHPINSTKWARANWLR